MKIILLKDVAHVGQAHTLQDVADGFARNYLVPQGLAVHATPGKLKELEQKQASIAKAQTAYLATAAEVAKKLEGFAVTLTAKAEKGTLFGSIGAEEVSAALKREGFEVPANVLKIEKPIKITGDHAVAAQFGEKLAATFVVRVKAEGEAAVKVKPKAKPRTEPMSIGSGARAKPKKAVAVKKPAKKTAQKAKA